MYICVGKKMESITIKVDNIVGAVRRLTRLFVFTCQKTFSFFFLFFYLLSIGRHIDYYITILIVMCACIYR
jgi:hypothetical protein